MLTVSVYYLNAYCFGLLFERLLFRFEAKFPAIEDRNIASDARHRGGENEASVRPVLPCRLLHDPVVGYL